MARNPGLAPCVEVKLEDGEFEAFGPAPKLPPPEKKFVSGLLRLMVESLELKEPFGLAAVAAVDASAGRSIPALGKKVVR